jgi:hypothetical protein
MTTKPELFIIESLTLENERQYRFEGQIIKDILAASGKQCEYYYLRTRRELKHMLKEFETSEYRYLHLSCHGSSEGMATTFDDIPAEEMQSLFGPYLEGRRVFASACAMTNPRLARALMPSGCQSILGFDRNLPFRDAAIMWASLYHVMFKVDANKIKAVTLRLKAQEVANMYRVGFRLFRRNSGEACGFSDLRIRPTEERDEEEREEATSEP